MKRAITQKFFLNLSCFFLIFFVFFTGAGIYDTHAVQKNIPKKSVKKIIKPIKKKVIKKPSPPKKSSTKKQASLPSQNPFFEVVFAPVAVFPVNVLPTPIPLVPPLPNDFSEKAVPKKELFISEPLTFKTSKQQTSSLTQAGILLETNKARFENGKLPALMLNIQLSKAAEIKVDDMFSKQYFEHVSPIGEGPADIIKTAQYQYIVIGENLALGDFQNDFDLVTGWMNSPGHRANILHTKFQEIGIAVKKGTYKGDEVWLAVQEFGKPLSACPSPDLSLKQSIESQKQELQKIKDELEIKKNNLTHAKNNPTTTAENYQVLVDEYNGIVAIYNEKVVFTRKNITDYNTQVAGFNTCIDQ